MVVLKLAQKNDFVTVTNVTLTIALCTYADYNRICWNNNHFLSLLFSCHHYNFFRNCNQIKIVWKLLTESFLCFFGVTLIIFGFFFAYLSACQWNSIFACCFSCSSWLCSSDRLLRNSNFVRLSIVTLRSFVSLFLCFHFPGEQCAQLRGTGWKTVFCFVMS